MVQEFQEPFNFCCLFPIVSHFHWRLVGWDPVVHGARSQARRHIWAALVMTSLERSSRMRVRRWDEIWDHSWDHSTGWQWIIPFPSPTEKGWPSYFVLHILKVPPQKFPWTRCKMWMENPFQNSTEYPWGFKRKRPWIRSLAVEPGNWR